MRLRTGLDEMMKGKFLSLPGLELRPLSRTAHIASLYTDCATDIRLAYWKFLVIDYVRFAIHLNIYI
jgi:hypothetical protein